LKQIARVLTNVLTCLIKQLADTKAAGGKGSLLHFLADIVQSRFPDLGSFKAELKGTISASKRKCQPNHFLLPSTIT
jgi:hypothetical protein